MKDYDVRAPGPDTLAVALSGGNQQKLIVGREMSSDAAAADRRPPHPRASTSAPRPPSGSCSRTPAPKGWRILLISADLDELIGLSDTLQVMLRGRLVATLDPPTVTPEELGGHMTGATATAGAA